MLTRDFVAQHAQEWEQSLRSRDKHTSQAIIDHLIGIHRAIDEQLIGLILLAEREPLTPDQAITQLALKIQHRTLHSCIDLLLGVGDYADMLATGREEIAKEHPELRADNPEFETEVADVLMHLMMQKGAEVFGQHYVVQLGVVGGSDEPQTYTH